ncbi:MAG: hypothetical protein CMH26_06295 [Micavibrio sp.]|nr:hypothetical protein [Micavibrio sp.]|tara:strand:+ start:117 stop:674 length:558 start_codon:yes stop_codon:yes gene_type:complete
MGKGKDNEDDELVWNYAIRDVKPIEKKRTLSENPKPTKPSQPSKVDAAKSTPPPQPLEQTLPKKPAAKKYKSSEIDARTNDRLRKGQIPIEAVLDMHGMNKSQAHNALNRFILSNQAKGKRCVLVITGKGQKNRDPLAEHEGVLKAEFQHWINEAPLKQHILQTHIAKPKDGGSGAYYVLLRRKR